MEPVTVIGLGLMGSAIARAVGNAGFPLTVWNRTPEKASQLEELARIDGSVEETCAASEVIVVSLLNYEVAGSVLRQSAVQAALAGKVLVQLSTGTPAEARAAAEWAEHAGITYLDGAIMTYPSGIGSEHATILYSGSRAAFDAHATLLRTLSANAVYCGEDPGAAAALDLALIGSWFGATAAVMHGAALCAAESVPLRDFSQLLNGFVGAAVPFALRAQAAAESGGYPAGNSTMITNRMGVRVIAQASHEANIDTSFPAWLLDRFTRVIDLGHGGDDIESLYEAFRTQSPSAKEQP